MAGEEQSQRSLPSLWAEWTGARVGGIFARQRSDPQSTSPVIYINGRTPAGVYIDPENALKQATVWACVTYIARTVAQLPWHVMLPRATGGADRQLTHPVDWLINVRPNPDMGSFTFRQVMLGNALRYGNSYAEIERDMRGIPVALWPVHPRRVMVDRNDAGGLIYRIDNYSAGGLVLDASDVCHIRGFGDGPVGMNVIEYAAQTIGWAAATEMFGSKHFGDGMNPSGVVEVPGALSPEAMSLLRQEFRRLYSGPRAERTAFLDAGMKWQKLSTTAEESQYTESMQHQVEAICRFFGVPPHKVQHLLRSTFSNIEHQAIEVVTDTIVPWIRIFEDEANYKFFGLNRQGLYTNMPVEGLLRGDTQARAQFYRALRELGAINVNEIRAKEDMNGIGLKGDAYFIPANMVTLERAIEGPPEPPKPVVAAPPPDEPAEDADEDKPAPAARRNGDGRRLPS